MQIKKDTDNYQSSPKKENGSVSIFLIIIFAAIFFFNAVLIDYARIMAADRQVENAVRAATRSILAAYDVELNQDYGLYGYDQDNYADIFSYILIKNLEVTPGYFNFVDTTIDEDSLQINFDHFLADQRVLEEQILQDFKYQAPINLSIDLASKFTMLTELATKMDEAAKTTEVLEEIGKMYDQRNEHLQAVANLQEQISTELANTKSFSSLSFIADSFPDYVSNVSGKKDLIIALNNSELPAEEKAKIEEELENLEEAIADYQATSQEAVNEVSSSYSTKISDYLQTSLEKIYSAKQLNEKIKFQIEQHQQSTTDEEQKDIFLKDDLVIEDGFFLNREAELNRLKILYSEITERVSEIKRFVSSSLHVSGNESTSQINNTKDSIRSRLTTASEVKNEFVALTSQEKTQLDQLNDSLDLEVVQKEKPEDSLGYQEINKIFELFEVAKDVNSDYQTVGKYYENYLIYNNVENQNNPEDFEVAGIDQAKKLSKLFTNLGQALLEFRDDLYTNEYILERFQHFEPTSLTEIIDFGQGDNQKNKSAGDEQETPSITVKAEKAIDFLAVENQEVEYIIYGSKTAGINVSKAFRDIFMLRLAINTIEGFSKAKSAGHPIAIITGAVLYGITQSVKDLILLIRKGSIPLSKYTKGLEFTYKDHLRLILMMRFADLPKLARVQALINYNTRTDLANVPTYVRTKATASINLLFLPAVIKGLGIVGALPGNVQDGRFYITKEAVFSY